MRLGTCATETGSDISELSATMALVLVLTLSMVFLHFQSGLPTGFCASQGRCRLPLACSMPCSGRITILFLLIIFGGAIRDGGSLPGGKTEGRFLQPASLVRYGYEKNQAAPCSPFHDRSMPEITDRAERPCGLLPFEYFETHQRPRYDSARTPSKLVAVVRGRRGKGAPQFAVPVDRFGQRSALEPSSARRQRTGYLTDT